MRFRNFHLSAVLYDVYVDRPHIVRLFRPHHKRNGCITYEQPNWCTLASDSSHVRSPTRISAISYRYVDVRMTSARPLTTLKWCPSTSRAQPYCSGRNTHTAFIICNPSAKRKTSRKQVAYSREKTAGLGGRGYVSRTTRIPGRPWYHAYQNAPLCRRLLALIFDA